MFAKNCILLIYLLIVVSFLNCDEIIKYEEISVKIQNGEDWSLSKNVQKSDYSGLFFVDNLIDVKGVDAIGYTVSWRDLNPEKDIYDFSKIKWALSEAKKRNKKLILRLPGSVVSIRSSFSKEANKSTVPDWIIKEYNPPKFYSLEKHEHKSEEVIEVIASWMPEVQAAYKNFIINFCSQNILNDLTLNGVYLHGFSTSYGEEFWLDEKYIAMAEKKGMTPQLVYDFIADRINWWALYSKENIYKIAWVNSSGFKSNKYNILEKLNSLALSKGLGWREGGLENFHKHAPPELGQSYENGYVITDWSYPLRSANRYFGEEVENTFSKYLGPQKNQKSSYNSWSSQDQYGIYSSIFRSAQLGLNHLWISPETTKIAPELVEWFSYIIGKTPKNSPDAVCWLREDYFYNNNKTIPWKNFERFLFQRDMKGGQTIPVIPQERPAFYQDVKDIHYDFTARKSNIKEDQNCFYFFLHDDFKSGINSPFKIMVNYYDNSKSIFRIIAGKNKTDNSYISSEKIIGKSDNKWKSASVVIDQDVLSDNLPNNCNIMILVDSESADLTVRFVRIVKM